MGGKSQKVTNETKVPKFIEDAYKMLVSRGEDIVDTPYNPAMDRSVAGFSPTQTQAFQNIQGMQGVQNPYLSQATNLAGMGAATISPENIAQYSNPFQNQVIDSTMAQIARNNAIQQNQLKGNSVAQSGLRNSRLGVAQAELARNQDMTTADTLAKLNTQNYSQALSAAQADKARAFQGASAYGALGQQAQNAGYQDVAALMGVGAQQQGLEQLQMDTASQNAAQQHQYPFQNLSWLGSLVQGVGANAGGTSTQTSPGPSALSQIAGIGLTALGLFSDERVKEDIERVGMTDDGLPVYTFRYRGDPRTHMGLMAQDVEEVKPEAVGSFGGIKTVDYDRATEGFATGGPVDLNGDGMISKLERLSHAAKGMGAIQKANGGRTEPKGIGAPMDMQETSPGNWEAPKGFSLGGLFSGVSPDLISNAVASGNVASRAAGEKSGIESALSGIGFKDANPSMIAAGLGIINSDKSNPLSAIAEGGMRGLQYHTSGKKGFSLPGWAKKEEEWQPEMAFADGGFLGLDDEESDPYDLYRTGDEADPLSLYGISGPAPIIVSTPPASSPENWQGLGVPRAQLPAGMRNNNPGNIKYFKGLNYPGLVGPSENTDQGDPQMLFDTPQSGMNAAYTLALRKYQGGKRTARDIIAGDMGWTPGNVAAADNIARTMGVNPDEDLVLTDPSRMQAFLRALTLQEHGPSSKLYGDDLYANARSVSPVRGGEPEMRSTLVQSATERGSPHPATSGIGAPGTSAPAAKEPGFLDRLFSGEPNLALMAAGLGILGGDSPFAGVNIGKGGLAGVQMLMQQRKAKEGAKKLADAAALAQQRLGIQMDTLKQRGDQHAATLAERKRHNLEIEKQRNAQGPSFSKNVIRGTKDGRPALIQPGDAGKAVLTELPEGFEIAADPIKVDAGTKWVLLDPQTRQVIGEISKNIAPAAAQQVVGTAEGQATVDLPKVEGASKVLLSKIDDVLADPYLPSMTGPVEGRLPNVSGDAARVQSKLDQLSGDAFLQAFGELKGGGAITEVEGQKAEKAKSRLAAMTVNDPDYLVALKDFRDEVIRLAELARQRAGKAPGTPATATDPLGIR